MPALRLRPALPQGMVKKVRSSSPDHFSWGPALRKAVVPAISSPLCASVTAS